MEEKKGRVTDFIFRNEENFYCVANVENDQDMECYTIVGNMPDVKPGITYTFVGEWMYHSKFGEQFKVVSWQEQMPEGTEAIGEFLGSGLFKGIGKKLAKRIIDEFGEDTLQIIKETPEELAAVKGISLKKAGEIGEQMRAHMEYTDIALFFSDYGISPGQTMRLYKIYGSDTIAIIKENPYRVVKEIHGIGFRTADEMAVKLGVDKNSTYRIESGVLYLLQASGNNGNVYIPLTELCDEALQLLDVSGEEIREVVEDMAMEGQIRLEELENRRVVYLYAMYAAENYVCRQLMALHDSQPRKPVGEIDEMIEMAQRMSGVRLSERQLEAVTDAVSRTVCVITGGPGTGKTTIINTIIEIFEANEMNVALAAPTGRAAKRITETSGHQASTIHRLLEYYYSEGTDKMTFSKTSEDPLEYDAIIIDEASMIDILLMDGLLRAIVPGTRLILVGDADQLPSVGPGNVLRDIIASEVVHCVTLNEIFRQAAESMITVNAHRINRGEYPFLNEKGKDFFMLKKASDMAVAETVKDLCLTRLPGYYEGTDPMRDIQVLTPVRKGVLGTSALNGELQKILNPAGKGKREKVLRERTLREGDKVMQIRNNYRMTWKNIETLEEGEGVFNGDVGYISGIDNEEGTVTVIYDDLKAAAYDQSQLNEIELAYAMTVHKSQGSEFPIVVMPLWKIPPMLAVRNLLYTAVTRGKKLVVLVGSERVLAAMVENNRADQRYSGLGVKLAKWGAEFHG